MYVALILSIKFHQLKLQIVLIKYTHKTLCFCIIHRHQNKIIKNIPILCIKILKFGIIIRIQNPMFCYPISSMSVKKEEFIFFIKSFFTFVILPNGTPPTKILPLK